MTTAVDDEIDLDEIRPDLAEVIDRHAVLLDDARPDAVARRRRTHQRTARENIDDLCDDGTFVEHGGLVLTPGTGLPMEEVIRKFPTDGMVCGVGSVNGEQFGPTAARAVVLAYDYTVLAGTQGALNHPKTDRMLELARAWRLPVRVLHRGRRRPGRHRREPHRRAQRRRRQPGVADPPAGHAHVHVDGPPERRGAHDRHQLRLLLRRQRRPPRRLRRHHRHRGLEHRHGRPGHDRGRRPRRVLARRGRPHRRAAGQRRGRHRRARRGRGRGRGQAVPELLPGPAARVVVRRPARAALGHPRQPAAHLRHPRRHRGPGRHRLGAGAAPPLRARHGHRAGPDRGPARRDPRQQPVAPGRAPSTATGRTRRPASCSCSTPSTSRCSCCATRPGSWWAPRSRRRRSCATATGCSSPAPTCRSRCSTWCCARPTASARWPWPAAT